ncbi:MAG: hypothetical protein RIR26_1697 [Pseudomonadota bacterium]
MNMKKRTAQKISESVLVWTVLCLGLFTSENAHAGNIIITRGWPCNVFLQQAGVGDASGNFAEFNAKSTPASGTSIFSSISGESAAYLTPQQFNSRVENLPLLEPLSFNLKSETFGAKLGVDVCIPAIRETQDDIVTWTVNVYGAGPLLPPADGDWFSQSRPRISMELLASNCGGTVASNMSTANPTTAGCQITSTPLPEAATLSASGTPVPFTFSLMASRQAVIRFTVEETSTSLRRHHWDAGDVYIEMTDPPLPPLVVGDLLGKMEISKPDMDTTTWPGCIGFESKSTGLAYSGMNLQGPAQNLNLSWTGQDNDCTTGGTCGDGNKRGSFSAPIAVELVNPSLPMTTSSEVKSFTGLFDDQLVTGESAYPSNGKIIFDATKDEVYHIDGKPFFSTTVSRLVAAGQWRTCRVWFKRDASFKCDLLPTPELISQCKR